MSTISPSKNKSKSFNRSRKKSDNHSINTRLLDLQYLALKEEITQTNFYKMTSKHNKIRIQSWLQRLDRIISNVVWKKNRNNYAKILKLMCQCEILIFPFNSMPPNNDISHLTKHQLNKIIDLVQQAVKKLNHPPNPKQKKNQKYQTTTNHHSYWKRLKEICNNSENQCSDSSTLNISPFKKRQKSTQKSRFSTNYYDDESKSHIIKEIDIRESLKENIGVKSNLIKIKNNKIGKISKTEYYIESQPCMYFTNKQKIQEKMNVLQQNTFTIEESPVKLKEQSVGNQETFERYEKTQDSIDFQFGELSQRRCNINIPTNQYFQGKSGKKIISVKKITLTSQKKCVKQKQFQRLEDKQNLQSQNQPLSQVKASKQKIFKNAKLYWQESKLSDYIGQTPSRYEDLQIFENQSDIGQNILLTEQSLHLEPRSVLNSSYKNHLHQMSNYPTIAKNQNHS